MSEQPKPEPGVEYGAFPNELFAEARSADAVRSLAEFLDVTPYRAAELLSDPGAYVAEFRSRDTARGGLHWTQAMSRLRKRYLGEPG